MKTSLKTPTIKFQTVNKNILDNRKMRREIVNWKSKMREHLNTNNFINNKDKNKQTKEYNILNNNQQNIYI